MGGPYGYYAKWDKSEKDKYEFTYVELKKKNAQRHREWTGYCWRGGVWGVSKMGEGGQEIQISSHK